MGEEAQRTHDVFVSYSSKDKTWADAACAVLERHRIRCWIAPRDITPGEEWGASIIKGLNDRRIMVLIFSGHANGSGQVRREVERAISQGMTVLPVRVEDVSPEGAMEFALGNTHWLDAFSPPVARQMEKLAGSVKTLLDNDVESPEGPGVTGDGHSQTEVNSPPDPPDPPEEHWPRAFWLMAVAASLISLVAMGAIMFAIKAGNAWRDQEQEHGPPAMRLTRATGAGRTVEHDASKKNPASNANGIADTAGAKSPIPPGRA